MIPSSVKESAEIWQLFESLNIQNHDSVIQQLSEDPFPVATVGDNVGEIRETSIEAPPSITQDKVSFLINNMSAANIDAKAKEFKEILEERFYPWFGKYFIIKRASTEPNFHKLYIDFLEKCNSVHLHKEVVEATYESCKVLLRSELIKSSVEERKLLKNLGGWLGKVTIGRNYVLRAKHIDPESLIIEAYEKGLMIGVIPFTSKILESCKNSIAYQPSHPWTMAILELLAEIHTMPNLKANIMFEIELLFKHLDVDMKCVTPASLLVDKVRIIEGNPDFSQGKTVIEAKPAVMSAVNQVVLQPEAAGPSYLGGLRHIVYQNTGQPHLPPAVTLGLSDQLSHIQGLTVAQFSHEIPEPATSFSVTQSFLLDTYFQSVLLAAMDKAIEELVSTIVKRTVSIAIQTTIELVLKDYVTEPDENVIRSASYWMVVYLAGNLSYVTCKEPLRSQMSTQLKSSLQCSSIASELHERVMQRGIDKKLELGCAAIEKAAAEKGLILVKREITQQLSIRRKNREGTRTGTIERKQPSQVNTSALPEEFDLKSGELYLPELEVYKEFVLFYPETSSQRWNTNTKMASANHPHNPKPFNFSNDSGVHGQTLFQPSASNCSTRNTTEHSLTTDAALNKYQNLLKKLDSIVATNAIEAEIQSVIAEVQAVICECINKDEAALSVAQKVFNDLYKNESNTAHVDACLSILASICDVCKPAGKDLTDWVLHSDDDRKFHKDITVGLIHKGLLNLAEYAIRMTKLVEAGKNGTAIEFLNSLLQTLEINNAGIIPELQNIVDALAKVTNHHIASRDDIDAPDSSVTSRKDNDSQDFSVVCRDGNDAPDYSVVSRNDNEAPDSSVSSRDNNEALVSSVDSRGSNKAPDSSVARRNDNDALVSSLDSRDSKDAPDSSVTIRDDKCGTSRNDKEAPDSSVAIRDDNDAPDSSEASRDNNDALVSSVDSRNSNEALDSSVANRDDKYALDCLVDSSNSNDAPDSSVDNRDDKCSLDSSVANRDDKDAPDSSRPDHPGFHEQVSVLFDEWCQICDRSRVNDKACARYVKQLHENVLLKPDDMPDRFFHLLLERAVSNCLSFERINSSPLQFKQEEDPACFLVIDRYTDLVFLIMKFYPADQRSSNKLSLLSKVLDVIVNFIVKDASEKKTSFNARPYFRLFINFFINDEATFKVLAAISDSFHSLQPNKVSEFSFAWLELVTHKEFMPKLLTESGQNRWRYFLRLVVDLLQFMEPKLRTRELPEAGDLLHKGTFRLLYVLNFEYPDFLCYYHFDLCEVISPHCAQLRNIILSAIPCNKKITNPYSQVDAASEMKNPPRILSNFDAALEANKLKNEVDEYLTTRPEESLFLSQLKYKLLLPSNEAERYRTCYNVPLMNSLVLYVGTKAIEQRRACTTPHASSKAKKKAKSVQLTGTFYNVALDNAAFDIFQALVLNLDSEGRYIFFNAVANHLRYPNNHTNYFSILLRHFFNEINQQKIQQQMITVLLERLILNHAFPWGTLVTFLDIVKYHRDDIWNLPFKKSEMEKISYLVSKYLDKQNPVKGVGASDAVRRKNIL